MTACVEPVPESEVSEVDDPELGEHVANISMLNRISANRIVANRLILNRIGANRLILNRIVANRLALNTEAAGELLTTPEGREVLEYLVSCAIPEDLIVEGAWQGVTYRFPGMLGLAPSWEKKKLKKKEQQWVSACMIARVNAYGRSVQISMRGPHDSLAASPEERARYSLEEGAFFGDIFAPADKPIEWYACRGSAQATGERGDLVDRDCAEEDPANPGFTFCGFTYAGDCADFTPSTPSPHACRRLADADDCEPGPAGYEDCYDAPVLGAPGGHHGAKKHKEVITVYVRP